VLGVSKTSGVFLSDIDIIPKKVITTVSVPIVAPRSGLVVVPVMAFLLLRVVGKLGRP
jgi:hypothetical protein